MILLFILLLSFSPGAEPSEDYMVEGVNRLRARGCNCGGQKMPPAPPIKWNDDLYVSALKHAKYLKRKRGLSHFGPKGEDISQRIAKTGYDWKVVGENLGEGQDSFREVMWDWIESPSHCKMLMNPKVDDMAVAKVGKYWVQHFGREFN